MPSLGYGQNGERLDPAADITWSAIAPPTPVNEGFDVWLVFPLGTLTLPFIDQNDDESFTHIYPGGV